ncbi:acyltransferase family protein [Pedobacter sp. CFBP9032]|uniref:acyltransferase family protein n=1 Tax=Pedobacter sp. CFBP9032 TaxID=3096539 RepID=UPI0039C9293B
MDSFFYFIFAQSSTQTFLMDIELQKPTVPVKKNFDFIDTIRCIAMIGIVMEHCTYNETYTSTSFTLKYIVYIGLIQFSKFGTISFFLLAGFLLGSKFTTYSSWEYFKRRLSTVFLPWLIWSLIFLCAILIQKFIALNHSGDFHLKKLLIEKIEMIYLFTNYWFIINFMFCIAILLCFKKYLYKWWLGGLLLMLSLIYSANVYFEWFITSHTVAIFGFIFYLWLGAMLNKYWNKIEILIEKIPMHIFVALFLITFCLAVFDIIYLMKLKSDDPYNTLRLSNIIYSIATIFFLFKIREFNFVKYLKPRETTFGVYLIHYIFVSQLLPEVYRPFQFPSLQEMSFFYMLLFIASRFIIVYGTTLLTIYLINKTRFRWVIGR